jgi:hypothetical protein
MTAPGDISRDSAPQSEPLRFVQAGDGYRRATGRDGTSWEIVARGDRFGLTVARGDRPDWWFETLEGAMAAAAERDESPPIPRRDWTLDIPLED